MEAVCRWLLFHFKEYLLNLIFGWSKLQWSLNFHYQSDHYKCLFLKKFMVSVFSKDIAFLKMILHEDHPSHRLTRPYSKTNKRSWTIQMLEEKVFETIRRSVLLIGNRNRLLYSDMYNIFLHSILLIFPLFHHGIRPRKYYF